MCVLETWIGGWTTSARMSDPVCMQCLFGCQHERDDLRHYVQCAPLWLLASEAIGIQSPFDLRHRLCLKNPTDESFLLLALCFQGYHYAKSLCEGSGENRIIVQDHRMMQEAVQQALRTFKLNFA